MARPVWSDWFYYDETSPSCLRWKIGNGRRVAADSKAGWIQNDVRGYDYSSWRVGVTISGKLKCFLVHRVIYELKIGPICDDFEIDHEDGNSLNNVISNLCLKTHKHNMRNVRKMRNNTSGITGVSFHRGKQAWMAIWKVGERQCSRSFSVSKHGSEEAFRLACEHRTKKIKELNMQGAGYTEDHGVRE